MAVDDQKWDSGYDVVVVGSGGAALAGALAAVKRELAVCVVEKSSYFGGSSAYSGGSVGLPGNHVLHVSQPDYLRRMTRFMAPFMFD